ncbi:hypothetical protein GCM10027073_59910 [Streptomyces chlorus]
MHRPWRDLDPTAVRSPGIPAHERAPDDPPRTTPAHEHAGGIRLVPGGVRGFWEGRGRELPGGFTGAPGPPPTTRPDIRPITCPTIHPPADSTAHPVPGPFCG